MYFVKTSKVKRVKCTTMPTCAIIGCTSGYRSNPEKIHLFTVPRDPVIRELWHCAIKPSGVTIKSGQSVCEKHFRADEVVWQRNHVASDGTVLGVVSKIFKSIIDNVTVFILFNINIQRVIDYNIEFA